MSAREVTGKPWAFQTPASPIPAYWQVGLGAGRGRNYGSFSKEILSDPGTVLRVCHLVGRLDMASTPEMILRPPWIKFPIHGRPVPK